jgi:hypothetical protein
MQYKRGFTIKPLGVNSVGEVTFTDGTNDVVANQRTCEAYGYRFNPSNGTCTAFIYNTKLNQNASNVHNVVKGNKNKTNIGTENSFVLGNNNTAFGDNLNIIISGKNNEISQNLNNCSILSGSFAESKNQGEVVLGGGGFNNAIGLSQVSFVQQSNKTTNNTETALLTQYLPLTYIQKVANSVIGFEANVIGVNYGGGEGEVGQYIYLQLKGAVVFTNGLASTYTQTSTTIAAGGLTATATMKDVTATSFGVNVTGAAETNIQWTASIKLWQNKLTTTF